MNISVNIPSYRRPVVETLRIFPFCKVWVCETEADDYRVANRGAEIVACKKGIQGNLCRIRNHILDTEFAAGADAVIILDDDFQGIARFDVNKLQWLNAHYMRALPVAELARLVRPFAEEAGYGDLSDERLQGLCTLFRERAKTLVELAAAFAPMLVGATDLAYDEKAVTKNIRPETKERLQALATVLKTCEPFEAEHLNTVFNDFVKDNNLTFKDIAPALRTALVGFMGGSHLHDIMAFLGREETLARIERTLSL